jgi:hypothetical protein
MSLLLAAAFRFDKGGVHWFWSDTPPVAIALLVLAGVLGVFWLRSQRHLQQR